MRLVLLLNELRRRLDRAIRETRGKRFSTICFTLSLYVLLCVSNIFLIIRYASFIPRADDWTFVPGVVASNTLELGWLWEQTADHRVPVQKAMMWFFWRLSPGTLWPAMAVGFFILALATLAILIVIWSKRGRPDYADIFFPCLLLTFGHANILLWWTTTGVPVFVALASLGGTLVIAYHDRPPLSAVAAVGAICVALPLLGSSGVAFSLPLAVALLAWAANKTNKGLIRMLSFLMSTFSIAVVILYILGFDRSQIQGPYVSPWRWAETTVQFLVMGLGVGAKRFWPAIGVVPILMLALIVCYTIVLWRRKESSLLNVVVVLSAIGAPVVTAAAVGWGRQYQGALIDRYILYAAPFYCLCFMFFTKFKIHFLTPLIQNCLCFFAVAGLFWGTSNGLAMAKGLKSAQEAFIKDVIKGIPMTGIVARHANHWGLNEQSFYNGLKVLKDSGIKPFKEIVEDPPLVETELPTQVTKSLNARSVDGRWICDGRESELVFYLPSPQHVSAVRIHYVLKSRFGSTKLRLRWVKHGSHDCFSGIHETVITKGFNLAKPRRVEQQTFWIDSDITAFGLSPSEGSCEFELKKVSLLTLPGGENRK